MSTPPEPAPRDLDRPFPLKDQVETILACCRDAPCEPTGITRELYLDLAERIARGVAKFQESAQLEAPTCWGPSRTSSGLRSAGEIVDPVEGLPSYQRLVTGRFAGAVGMLLEAGRAKDLAAKGVKAMTLAIEALSQTGKPNPIVCAEFFPREVVSGLAGYAPYVGEETVRRWRAALAFDPESGYHDTLAHKPLEAIFNWNSFGLVSEQLKTLHGIGGDAGFIERYLPRHRTLFDANGMYRDPNCPMTYDAVVRQNFSVMLHAGYNGSHRAWMEEALRRGALAALLFQSPTGEAPFGGRSNQFHLVEATHAGCWEFQARQAARGRIPHMRMCGIPRFQPPRTAAEGDCALAGVFKRAARRAAMSTRRWILEADPFRHQKSFFAPGTHGVDSGGNYTMYGITAAALFCHAYRLADESIGECATPAEVGGFVVESSPDFHKVFATCAGAHIEIDTRADLAKDATGIGRFHYESLRARPAEGTSAELFNSAILPITKKPVFFEKTGFWPSAACRGEQTKDGGARMAELFNSAIPRISSELGLSGPCSPRPAYTIAVKPTGVALAIGPVWRASGPWVSLAEISAEVEPVGVEIRRQDATQVEFTVTWKIAGWTVVRESVSLSRGRLEVADVVEGVPPPVRAQVPVLAFDGERQTEIAQTATGYVVRHRGHLLRIQGLSGTMPVGMVGESVSRNGVYRVGLLESQTDTVHYALQLE